MVKFSGVISKGIQRRVAARRNIRKIVLLLSLNLLLMAIAGVLLFLFFPKGASIVLGTWGGALILEIAPYCVVFVKEENREIVISEKEIVISTFDYLNKTVQIPLSEIKKVVDYGEFYLLKYAKGKREIICVKELLSEGTTEELKSYFQEILTYTRLSKKKLKKREAEEELPLNSALLIFEGYNSYQATSKAEMHENKRGSFLFFSVAIVVTCLAVYDWVVGNTKEVLPCFVGVALLCLIGVLLWNMKMPPAVLSRHRIVITKDTVFDAHLILNTLRKLKVEKVKKVVDYGEFYEIKGRAGKGIICEKSLMIKGSCDDFEELFRGKLKFFNHGL